MVVLADTHVHLYPHFNLAYALNCAVANLERSYQGSAGLEHRTALLFLTERVGAGLFSNFPSFFTRSVAGVELLSESPGAYHLRIERRHELFLIAGHQTVSAEGLEVLGLCLEPPLVNAMSVTDTLAAIADCGGVAVLPWSPGKWMGQRGKVVDAIVDTVAPDSLLLGDIYMRPQWSPTPKHFKRWLSRGGRIVSGSDPLPLEGEERLIGSYGNWSEMEFSSTNPLRSAKEFLTHAQLNRLGCRSTILATIRRQLALRSGKSQEILGNHDL